MQREPKRLLFWLIATCISITFVAAAVMKFRFVAGLESDICSFFHIAYPNAYASVLAKLVIAGELALGLALLQPHWRRRLVLPAIIVMLAGFTVYLTTVDPNKENCNCFGAWIVMSPKESILKNIILQLMAAACYYLAPKDNQSRLAVPGAALLASIAITFAFATGPAAVDLNKPFKGLHLFADLDTDISQDRAVVCFFNPTCEHCMAVADELPDIQNAGIPIVIGFLGTQAEIDEFQMMCAVEDIPFHRIKVSEFFDYVGDAPPRIYLLQDGKVVKYWDMSLDAMAKHEILNP